MADHNLDASGTVRLFDDNGERLDGGQILLIPTPSSSPQDPLNWSQRRKHLHLFCVSLYTLWSAFSGGVLYSIFEPLSEQTGLSLAQLNAGTGYVYLFIGIGLLVTQPAALAFGKRPVYIFSSIASGAIGIWQPYTTSYAQWIAVRLLSGVFAAPSFALVEASIADIYFSHERALPMGVYVFFLYFGVCIGPLCSGYIYEGLGWAWCIYIATILQIATGIFLILFCEETNFHRNTENVTDLPADTVPATEDDQSKEDVKDIPMIAQPRVDVEPATPTQRMLQVWPGPRPFAFQKPSPYWAGIMGRGFFQSLVLLRLPIVLWLGFMYGIYQVYFNMISGLTGTVLALPPYNFATGSIGLAFLAPGIGAVPGAVWGGYISDWFMIRMARRNGGISEPEHGLILMIIPAILGPLGFLMMGLGPLYEAHWIVYVLGTALLDIGGPLATLVVLTYAFDTFHSVVPANRTGARAYMQECAPYLLSIILFGMLITFGFGYAITPWLFEAGYAKFTWTAVLSTIIVNGSTFAIYNWGKKLRQQGQSYYLRVINW